MQPSLQLALDLPELTAPPLLIGPLLSEPVLAAAGARLAQVIAKAAQRAPAPAPGAALEADDE